jgi:hypothetical protein
MRERLRIAMGALLHELSHLTTQTLQLVEDGHHLTASWPMFWGTYGIQRHNTAPETGPTGQEQRDMQQTLE